MIELRDVHFAYGQGDFRLAIGELRIDEGEAAAVVGPSGCGKTTLLHLVAGIVVPRAGSVRVHELDLARTGDAGRRDFRVANIGLVFQEFELLDYLSVLDNILLPYRITSALRLDRDVKQRARQLADEVGIGDKLDRPPRRLSQGERQRVAVCRALVAQPPLLLADEPTGNLDPGNKERVLDILLDQARRSGATLLTVTHDHSLLDRFDRVLDAQEWA